MKIDIKDIISKIEEIYACGVQADGTHSRLAFSKEDRLGREKFMSYFHELGIETRVDAAGNVIACMEGEEPNLPSIVTGSHLDTVPDGGKYDGVLGCMAGYGVCRALKEKDRKLKHNLEVIVFTDEEGARFGSGLFGSNYFCKSENHFPEDDLDSEGRTRKEVMEAFGIDFSKASEAKRDKNSVHCFLELHIEQGASLDAKKVPVGIVTSIAGVKRYEVSLEGEANHSGSTLMKDRKDALVSAAQFIGSIPDITKKHGMDYTVATVGTLKVSPGSVNVVPGNCVFSLEIRDQSDEIMHLIETKFKENLEKICGENKIVFSFRETLYHPPAPMAEKIKEVIQSVCEQNGTAFEHMPSGAFHDSLITSEVFPTGMIFIPSVKGISHSPNELSLEEDIETGCEILLNTILELDRIETI